MPREQGQNDPFDVIHTTLRMPLWAHRQIREIAEARTREGVPTSANRLMCQAVIDHHHLQAPDRDEASA